VIRKVRHTAQVGCYFAKSKRFPTLTLSFQFAFADKDDIDSLRPLRLCMLVDASSVPAARKQLKSLFEPGNFQMTV
jgi:hypothetical protein